MNTPPNNDHALILNADAFQTLLRAALAAGEIDEDDYELLSRGG